MIGLILSMIQARRAQALTLLLLSIFTVAAAVAGPAALSTVDNTIVAHELAHATAVQRTVSLVAPLSGTETSNDFDTLGPKVLALPGFTLIGSVQHDVFAVGKDKAPMVYRDGVCTHLVLTSGRCPVGAYEILISQQAATRTGVRAGTEVTVWQAVYDQLRRIWIPGGTPSEMTVSGTYQVRDAGEVYWGRQSYFTSGAEAVFATRLTLRLADHSTQGEVLNLDAVAGPDAITAARVAPLERQLASLRAQFAGTNPGAVQLYTDVPTLLDPIDRGRELAHQLVPVAFVPLVVLCLFVIYLAVAYGVFGRRHEAGLVGLRGVSGRRRWWLATGETTLVILLGAPIGYVVGLLAVRAIADSRLDGTRGTLGSWPTVLAALAAVVGALAAAQLGQWSELRAHVSELLRGVTRRRSRLRSLLVEILVVLLAVVATVQLRVSGIPTGLAILVPGLVIAAVGLIAARALVPFADAVARRAFRRGRLGTALAAVQLARRPGTQRLLMLLSVALAILGFVVSTLNVAGRARREDAIVANGAPTVATLAPVEAGQLLAAVHAADPEGRYALAVSPMDVLRDGDLPFLAVDTTRLASTGLWRSEFGGGGAQAIAAALHPAAPPSATITGTMLLADVEGVPGRFGPDASARINAVLAADDGTVVTVQFGPIKLGRDTYQEQVAGCTAGCRLVSLQVLGDRGGAPSLVLHSLSQLGPDATIISAQQASDPAYWRAIGTTRLTRFPDGIRIDSRSNGRVGLNGLLVADVPQPLPVATTLDLGEEPTITGLDAATTPVVRAAEPVTLPRLGRLGGLVDLEYAARTAASPALLRTPEVWLGAQAPADAVQRLTKAGLTVLDVTSVSAIQSRLDGEGPALALWFHLVAAAFGVVLAIGGVLLVATVDRSRRGNDLRALRRQGLPRRFVRRATTWGNVFVVLAGACAGLVAAAAAWLAVGNRLPVVADDTVSVPPPRWPDLAPVGWPLLVGFGAILVVAVLAAWDLRRAVARGLRG